MSGRLDGKVAIITGASTGLGPVMAKRFVDEGAHVLLAARREELVQEAGELIAFLLSDRAAYMTGAVINIDGGTDFGA